MSRRWMARLGACVIGLGSIVGLGAGGAAAAEPAPGSPEYLARDTQNIADAYGRQTGPGGQLRNPLYLAQLAPGATAQQLQQLADQAAQPGRPAISPGAVFPGWNRGNPLRDGWEDTRGIRREVSFTNRYGAQLRGDVFAPRPGAAAGRGVPPAAGCACPVRGRGAPPAVPGRGHHHGVGPGLGADVL